MTIDFYKQIKGNSDFDRLFHDEQLCPLPDDWLIVVADVEKSTDAVHRGLYREVNGVGVSTITAVLAACGTVAVPYVFGGDGASFCIPPEVVTEVSQALVVAREVARKSFKLGLRIGMVPVTDIRQAGADVLIGKYQPSAHYEQAVFSGAGLAMADQLVKARATAGKYQVRSSLPSAQQAESFMNGFECRWDEIPPDHDEVVNILIQVLDEDDSLYRKIISTLRDIYGCDRTCYPISEQHMRLSINSKKLGVEAKIRCGLLPWYKRLLYLFKIKAIALIGEYLMRNKISTRDTDWGSYKARLIENTDFQRFDDMLRLMVAGNEAQRERFLAYLDKLAGDHKLVYGIHVTSHSLVTCMISDYNHAHVHFIDGKGGGYTLAAVQLKQQLARLRQV